MVYNIYGRAYVYDNFPLKIFGSPAKKQKVSFKNISKTGVLTVKKGTKKGTYKILIKVAENDFYKQAKKTVTVVVK